MVEPPSPLPLDDQNLTDETLSTGSDSVEEHAHSRPKKAFASRSFKPGKKIRTYTRRKTEIEELRDEIWRLNRELDAYGERAHVVKQRVMLIQGQLTNKALRNALHAQHLSFACTMSMVSQFCRTQETGPFDVPTRLGRDPLQRHTTLLKMKRERLQRASEFMLRSQQGMPAEKYSDRKHFTASSGDFKSISFEIEPLPDANSVKTVLDALQTFIHNYEISITEAVGDITLRENDDPFVDTPVAQHRLVTTVAGLVDVEVNNVAFAEFSPAGQDGGEHALLVCDTVDEDNLFPYRPSERVRHDITKIVKLNWQLKEEGEHVIVLTRWQSFRIHKPLVEVPPFLAERIRGGIDTVAAAMLSTARHGASTLLQASKNTKV